MPPPATIYGHICSAVGEWLRPSSLRFSYFFAPLAKGSDYEHVYQFSTGSGKRDKKLGCSQNLKGELVPVWRDFMLNPKLILYLDAPGYLEQLYNCFRSPRYPVILGRSQDIAGYRKVEVVSLESASSGYFENTLLPWTFRLRTKVGTPTIMPRFIHPDDRQRVSWEPYIILENRLFLLDKVFAEGDMKVNYILRNKDDGETWIDPDSPEAENCKRIVLWHTFVEK
jgi:CRISPR-associated protein Cas5t